MTASPRPAVLTLCLALLATLLVVVTPPPAAEAATPRPQGVWDIAPASGEVVPAGRTTIKATAYAPSGIASVEVRADGTAIPYRIVDSNATAARVYADWDVPVGEHVVSVRFTANDGRASERTWRIAGTDVALTRLQGPDRYATAVTIASSGRERRAAPAAVLARGDDHADALAGVPLAQHLEAPLLLTESRSLPTVTAQALRDLVQPGGTVHLLGGSAAISGGVATAVRDLGFSVTRHAGKNRYQTAVRVAAQLPAFTEAIVASGSSFPDALSAAAPAALTGQPILLTEAGRLSPATRATIEGLDRVTLVGGAAVLAPAVQQQADQVAGRVRRVSGRDRYATSRQVLATFDLGAETLGLASGESFPDALAGALDAARRGTGLLLTDDRRLPRTIRTAIGNLTPTEVRVYGGEIPVHGSVAAEARNAARDRGPAVIDESPAATVEMHSLDQITLTFAEALDIPKTSVSVEFAGRELPTSFASGDFDDTLVLSLGAMTVDPNYGDAVPVRVTGAVRGKDGGWSHIDRTWVYRKIAVSSGDQGAGVRQLQERLQSLGYWLGSPDGKYGSLTVQAVMAFQKYEGLPITGTADDATQARLATAQRPVPADTSAGYHVEIDKRRQIIMFAANGRTRWTMNVSTGSEVPYDEEGGSGTAITPTGEFDVCYERDYLRESSLGTLWRPKYFQCGRGIAVHGATSVPGYPASHGCVRVTYAAMNFIWEQDLMPMGARVWVYGSIPT